MKSLIFAGLLLCLLTAAATSMLGHVSGSAAAAAAEVNDGGTSSWGNQLPDMLVSYFRQHGVHSLMLVVCHGDIGELRALCDSTPPEWVAEFMTHLSGSSIAVANRLHLLVQVFMANNFYVQVSTERCMNDLRHVNNESDFPEAPPPRSFRVDNDTHWPLSFLLPPSSHKLGILLLQFTSPCALNLLRWSAASEHNYFTTNRFWLLLTQNLQDVDVLEDAEIFIPPDSELKVLWHSDSQPFTSTLLDIYKVAAWKPLKRHLVGQNLRNSRHLVHALQHYGSPITYRQNLEGIVFNSAIVIAFPDVFTNIEDLSLRHIDTISKVNHRLMLELANRLNMR